MTSKDVWDKLMTVANPSYDVSVGTGENTIAQKSAMPSTFDSAFGHGSRNFTDLCWLSLMMSGGNDDQITKAKTIVKQVVVGLIVLSLGLCHCNFRRLFVSQATVKSNAYL